MTQTPDFEDRPASPPAEAEATGGIEAELAEARAQAAEYRDNFLRAVAEADNVRKRAQRDVEAASRYAVERFAAELLDVRDSLELGTAAAGQGAGTAQLLEGMDATLRLLTKAFEKAGISVVDPLGQPFDPEYHEAMATQPSANQPPGTVLSVVQKGYLLNGRLLRPARVLVSRAADPAPGAS
ncbi:MAG: nucleotide exchange factor GrpE [Lysobacterales bacterium]|jgi:molecular chaperone GrpE|nr:MAG: nucleotide exchange factor GrpE [Xanthomonadales bacterium]